MNTIKVVYDWTGPNFPIINNKKNKPSIFDFILKNPDRPEYSFAPEKFIEIIRDVGELEITPLFALREDEYFIYELTVLATPDGFFNNKSDLIKEAGISKKILEKIRNGKGYLLFELSCESYLEDVHFRKLHSYCQTYNIPLNKVIYITGSTNGKNIYNRYCNRNGIKNRMHIYSFSWFEYLGAVQLRTIYSNSTQNTKDFYDVEKTFLCYNNKQKSHRVHLFGLFYKTGLLNQSYFSMPTFNLNFEDIWEQYAIEGSELISHFNITKNDVINMSDTLPLTLDDPSNDSEKVKLILPRESNLTNKSLISLVTESNFKLSDLFLTEKTFKPIANKHPFIIVGPCGILKHLREKGYKTFNNFFDESYDLEPDNNKRLIKIWNLCDEINNWNTFQKFNFFVEAQKITEHNYNVLYNFKPDRSFWNEFYNGLVALNK